jgi:signal transduction histidine kinase
MRESDPRMVSAGVQTRRDLTRLFVFPLLVMVVFVALMIYEIRTIADDAHQANLVSGIASDVQSSLLLIVDMESGLRGYLTTGDPVFLEPYHQAAPAIGPLDSRIRRSVADDPADVARIDELAALESDWRSVAEAEISLRQAGESIPVPIMLERKQAMDVIRAKAGEFIAVEKAEREVWLERGLRTEFLTLFSAIVLGIIAGGSFGLYSRSELSRLTQRFAQQQRSLIEARAAAEAANRAKDDFTAMVSHELRTPVATIFNWTEVLRKSGNDPAALSRAINAIERSGRMQLQIVGDLLDVARITTGKIQINPRQIEIAPVIVAALEAIRDRAVEKQITLSEEIDPNSGAIFADPDRLHQIAWNLVSNAIKFTPEGGTVDVSLKGKPQEVELIVTDSGKGIDPNEIEHVFDRFWQGASGEVRTHDGLGLGLTIVRHLVELHGGTVTVFSEGKGRGAQFKVTLPRKAQSIAPTTDSLA